MPALQPPNTPPSGASPPGGRALGVRARGRGAPSARGAGGGGGSSAPATPEGLAPARPRPQPQPGGRCRRPGRSAEPRGGGRGEGVCRGGGGRGAASPLPPGGAAAAAAAATAVSARAAAGARGAGRGVGAGAGGRGEGPARPATSPRGRPWRRRRRRRLTLGACCRAPGRHVRGWRGRAGRRRGGSRARGAARAAPRAPAGLAGRRRRRGLGRLRTGDGRGGGGHGRGTGRRRLGPDRREEGATALRAAGQETGETRSVLRLQGTRSQPPGRRGGSGQRGAPRSLPLCPRPRPRRPPGAAAPRKCCCRSRPISCFSDQSPVGLEEGESPRPRTFHSSPSEGVASASALLGCPGALLLCRSPPEAPAREWSSAHCVASAPGPRKNLLGDLRPSSPVPHRKELGGRREGGIGSRTPGASGDRRRGRRGRRGVGRWAQPEARVLELGRSPPRAEALRRSVTAPS